MHANRNYRPKQQKTICPTLSDRKQTKELSLELRERVAATLLSCWWIFPNKWRQTTTVECCYLPPRIWHHEPDLQIRVSSPVSRTAESIVFLLANEKSTAVVASAGKCVVAHPPFPTPLINAFDHHLKTTPPKSGLTDLFGNLLHYWKAIDVKSEHPVCKMDWC